MHRSRRILGVTFLAAAALFAETHALRSWTDARISAQLRPQRTVTNIAASLQLLDPLVPNSTVRYRITVTNTGRQEARGVYAIVYRATPILKLLPEQSDCVVIDGRSVGCFNSPAKDGFTLYPEGDLRGASSRSFIASYAVPADIACTRVASTLVANMLLSSDTNVLDNSFNLALPVSCAADPAPDSSYETYRSSETGTATRTAANLVTQVTPPASLVPGGTAAYTISVDNIGLKPAQGTYLIHYLDGAPGLLTYVSRGADDPCVLAEDGKTVVCHFGNPPLQPFTLTPEDTPKVIQLSYAVAEDVPCGTVKMTAAANALYSSDTVFSDNRADSSVAISCGTSPSGTSSQSSASSVASEVSVSFASSSQPLAPRCGDGLVQAERGEVCDAGEARNGLICQPRYGEPECLACSATCTAVLHTPAPRCGDGRVDSAYGEQCDPPSGKPSWRYQDQICYDWCQTNPTPSGTTNWGLMQANPHLQTAGSPLRMVSGVLPVKILLANFFDENIGAEPVTFRLSVPTLNGIPLTLERTAFDEELIGDDALLSCSSSASGIVCQYRLSPLITNYNPPSISQRIAILTFRAPSPDLCGEGTVTVTGSWNQISYRQGRVVRTPVTVTRTAIFSQPCDLCGNGRRDIIGSVWEYPELYEQCDDFNLRDGDGCSASCKIESARTSVPVISIRNGDSNPNGTPISPSFVPIASQPASTVGTFTFSATAPTKLRSVIFDIEKTGALQFHSPHTGWREPPFLVRVPRSTSPDVSVVCRSFEQIGSTSVQVWCDDLQILDTGVWPGREMTLELLVGGIFNRAGTFRASVRQFAPTTSPVVQDTSHFTSYGLHLLWESNGVYDETFRRIAPFPHVQYQTIASVYSTRYGN